MQGEVFMVQPLLVLLSLDRAMSHATPYVAAGA